MPEIRSKYYRVSVKALVLNETKDKFLLMRQENDIWDLPGGGLDWGENPHDCLKREIQEETGRQVVEIEPEPSYFIGGHPMTKSGDVWIVNIVYKTIFKDLNFTPSDECQEIRFVSITDFTPEFKVPPTVVELAEKFERKN